MADTMQSAQGQRIRTVAWEDPLQTARHVRALSGLEYFQGVIDGRFPLTPSAQLIGYRPVEAREGYIVFEMIPDEHLYNTLGTVHGGILSTLFDSALGCAVHSTLPAGASYTTLELHVNFLRAVTKLTGTLRCVGQAIHVGRSVGTSEAKLFDSVGKLYGHATTTCMIFRDRE